MEINLSREAIVDQRTGVVDTTPEYFENLQAIEQNIVRVDEEIAAHQDSLKHARARRLALVGQLRSGVREGKVLPLFEATEATDPEPEPAAADPDKGLDVDDPAAD